MRLQSELVFEPVSCTVIVTDLLQAEAILDIFRSVAAFFQKIVTPVRLGVDSGFLYPRG